MFAAGKLTGDVKELVNELLNSSEFACELLIKFPFPAPNKNAEKDTIICANSAFLLFFKGVFALLGVKIIVCDKKSLSSESFYAPGGWTLFLLSLKLRVFVKTMILYNEKTMAMCFCKRHTSLIFFTEKQVLNLGECDSYIARDHHKAIIPRGMRE